MGDSIIIVLIVLLLVLWYRGDLCKTPEPEPERVVSVPTKRNFGLSRFQQPKKNEESETTKSLNQMNRNVRDGEYEIEERAQLEQAEYHGYRNLDGMTTADGLAFEFNPDNTSGDLLASHEQGPEPQDYTQAIKRIGLEPGVIENHAKWIEDQRKFTNAYATKTSGRNHAINEWPEPIPWRGLRRPQAVPNYGVMTSIPDTPEHRIKENKKFVFRY